MKRFGKICLSLAAIFGAALSLASCSKKVWTVEFLDGTNSLSTQQVNNKETVNKPADPTKTDYVFDDWYAEETLSTKFNFDTKIVSDTKIYAKFNQTVFTIKFNTNGGSEIEDKKVNLLETLVLPDNPTKDGGKFEGWFTDASLSQAFDATTKINSNLTLYAKWSDIVTLTFNSNGGSAITVQTIKKGSKAVAVEAPEKKGYTFVDWYKDEAFETVFNFETEVLNENTVIYAKWNRLPDPFGDNTGFGTLEGKELLSWEDLLTWAPVDSGVKFTEDLTSGNYTFGKGARIDTNILNTQGKNITVVLDGVDGANALHVKLTGASSTKVGNVRLYKDDLECTPLYESGRVLENKSVLTLDLEDLANGTYIINIKDDTVTDGDASVSAKVDYIYNDVIEKVTVTFDSDGGAAVDPQKIVKGSKATAPTSPEKASYRFDGWFLGEATTAFDFATVVTEDITLKAHWTLLSDPVTVKVYNLNLVNPSSSELLDTLAGEKNEEMTVTPKTITGFKFISLFDENGKYVPVTFTPTADTNLYALYEKTSYALADDNGDFALLIKDGANITLSGSNVVFSSSIAPLNKEDKDIKESEISNAYVFEALFKGKLTITFDIKGKDGAVAADKTIALYVFVADENGTITHKESAELNTANPVITDGTLEFDVNGFNRLYIGRKGGTALYLSDLTIECEIEDSNILEIHYMDEGEEKSENIEVYKSETIGEALTLRYFQAGKNYVVKESKDATEVFDTNVKLTGYRTLFIAEEAIEYTLKCVYVDGDNTEVLETSKFNVNDGILINNGPDKAHKLFIDWFFDKSLTKGINGAKFDDFVKACDENNTLTLYARYDDAATLTLKVDDDVYQAFTVVKDTKLTAGDLENVILELEKTGYNFLGWFVTENNVDTKITIDTNYKVEKDTVANAKFEKKTYTVTFDADGGVFADATLASQIVAYDTVISSPAVSKSAHNFLGWFLADETTAYDFSNAIKGALAFKAHWELDTTVVTRDVTITSNVSANEKTIQVEDKSNLTTSQLSVTGYTVIGVYTDNTKATEVTLPVVVESNINLYVVYGGTITIAVNDDTLGTVDKTTVAVATGETITVNNNVVTVGTTDVTATPKAVNDAKHQNAFIKWSGIPQNNVVEGDATITANFDYQIKPFTILFNTSSIPAKSGTVTTDCIETTGTDAGKIYGTVSAGDYVQVVEKAAGDKVKIVTETSNKTIYQYKDGVYTAVEALYTCVKTNGKTQTSSSVLYRYIILDLTGLNENDNILLQLAIVGGTDGRLVEIADSVDDVTSSTVNIQTYASVSYVEKAVTGGKKYYIGGNGAFSFYAINVLPVEQVEVIVDKMDGSAATAMNVNKYAHSFALTRDNYNLVGLYTVNNAGTLSKPLMTEDYLQNGTTVFAEWSPVEYTITYNGMDGATNASANVAKYTIESAEITLADPSKAGFTFTGWTFEGQDTPVKNPKITTGSTGNKTFTANWTEHTYTLKYNPNSADGGEGSELTDGVYKYTDEITLRPADYFSNSNSYNFSGWKNLATNTQYSAGQTISGLSAEDGAEVVLTAVWTSGVTYTVAVDYYNPAHTKVGTGSITVAEGASPAVSDVTSLPSGYDKTIAVYAHGSFSDAAGVVTADIDTTNALTVVVAKNISATFNFDGLSTGEIASNTNVGGTNSIMTLIAASDRKLNVEAKGSMSYEDAEGNNQTSTNRLKTNGSTNSKGRQIKIDLSDYYDVDIIVYAIASGKSDESDNRYVEITETTWDNATGKYTSEATSTTEFIDISKNVTGGKEYFISVTNGMYIYAVCLVQHSN